MNTRHLLLLLAGLLLAAVIWRELYWREDAVIVARFERYEFGSGFPAPTYSSDQVEEIMGWAHEY